MLGVFVMVVPKFFEKYVFICFKFRNDNDLKVKSPEFKKLK